MKCNNFNILISIRVSTICLKLIVSIRRLLVFNVLGKIAELYQRNDPDRVPFVRMLPKEELLGECRDNSSVVDRCSRCQNRNKLRREIAETSSAEIFSDSTSASCSVLEDNDKCIGTQTDLTGNLIYKLERELQTLRAENNSLKGQLNASKLVFDNQLFEGNNEKVLFFTGLQSWHILVTLFNYLHPHLPLKKSLSAFQIFILTLMRLRLNISNTCLSYLFSISNSTVTRILSDVIDVMFVRMKPFIIWLTREALWKTMPMQFRQHFGKKCAVIIDCFEVFIDRPSNLKARAEIWSSYKHHNTIKFLIGITPQGTVSYISNSWGGRASDKYITEHCGILDNILPGDLVLADRGFDIACTLGCMMAEVEIPSFTKGKSQLSPLDLENTRHIASVRIHVECVIGCVRQKYGILAGPLPTDFLMGKKMIHCH